MSNEPRKIITRVATDYTENTVVRASVQAIPWIGGPLDTLLAGTGSKIQADRLQQFLSELSERLGELESPPKIDEEQLYDLAMDAIQKAVRARADEKRLLFAQIMFKQIAENEPYDEAEMALRIVSELDSVHLKILTSTFEAPIAEGVFEGLRVVSLSPNQDRDKADSNQNIPVLTELLSEYPQEVVRLAVAELVAKGLLHDEGIGRYGGQPMQQFITTETAEWMKQWLA